METNAFERPTDDLTLHEASISTNLLFLLLFLPWLFLVCEPPALADLVLRILLGIFHSSEPALLLVPRLLFSSFFFFFFSFLSFFSFFFLGLMMGPWERAASCSCMALSCQQRWEEGDSLDH